MKSDDYLNQLCSICGLKGGFHDKDWKHKFKPKEITKL